MNNGKTKLKSFSRGEKVVFPKHGVGLVNAIVIKKIGEHEEKLYDISILSSGMKVLVPVGQAESRGLRCLVDKKDVSKVYAILKQRDVKIDSQTWNRRLREYTQKIHTGSIFEIAEVMRDLSALGDDKELSFGEKRMRDMAKQRLVSEIALAKGSSEDKVIGEIQALL